MKEWRNNYTKYIIIPLYQSNLPNLKSYPTLKTVFTSCQSRPFSVKMDTPSTKTVNLMEQACYKGEHILLLGHTHVKLLNKLIVTQVSHLKDF